MIRRINNVNPNGGTASIQQPSGSSSLRSDSRNSVTAMASERGKVRERDIGGLTAETVGREKVSTDRASEKISTEPPGVSGKRDVAPVPRKYNTSIPHVLPHERVFPIQIGSEMFRLSGASISSDAPSYFSQFFQCQLEQAKENGDTSNSVRTLYIDRDPVTFQDISLHLQGYHIVPRDGLHFVKLFADAQFYSLPRLISQLHEENIFISIGHRDFQIPRDIFSDPGNSPNYFSLGFAVFFSTPTEIFPGLEREGLIRPPSILPPAVPNRSAETFSQILHLLRGYPIEVRNEAHRAELVRDCRYFHLKGLEQKLLRHEISFNLARKRHEITLCLEDVRQSGVSVVSDLSASSPSNPATPTTTTSTSFPNTPFLATPNLVGFVNYARPFVDTQPYKLILEIGSSETKFRRAQSRVEFFGDSKTRIGRLFEVIASKINLPTSQPLGLLMKQGGRGSQPPSPGNSGVSEDLVRVVFGSDTYVTLDGREWRGAIETDAENGDARMKDGLTPSLVPGLTDDWLGDQLPAPPSSKRRKGADGGSIVDGVGGTANSSAGGEEWIIKTGLWRLRVQNAGVSGKSGVECVLMAVRIDAVTSEYGRNAQRGFLGG